MFFSQDRDDISCQTTGHADELCDAEDGLVAMPTPCYSTS